MSNVKLIYNYDIIIDNKYKKYVVHCNNLIKLCNILCNNTKYPIILITSLTKKDILLPNTYIDNEPKIEDINFYFTKKIDIKICKIKQKFYDVYQLYFRSILIPTTEINVKYLFLQIYDTYDINSIVVWGLKLSNILDNKNHEHYKKIIDADLAYPLLIFEENKIHMLDGHHRLIKAYLNNISQITVKFVKKPQMALSQIKDWVGLEQYKSRFIYNY